MKDNKLINSLSMVSLVGRVLIFLLITLFWQLGGFRWDECKTLLTIVAPISVLLISAFVRFAIKHPYALPRGEVSIEKGRLSIWLPMLAYLVYFGLIMLSALSSQFVSFDTLVNALTFGELLFAAYTATILGDLFEKRQA